MKDEQVGGDDCLHGLPEDWCVSCRMVGMVWISDFGECYHLTPLCRFLQKGQRKAERLGMKLGAVRAVPRANLGRRACEWCHPFIHAERLADERGERFWEDDPGIHHTQFCATCKHRWKGGDRWVRVTYPHGAVAEKHEDCMGW